jgi:2-iminoacetate synthase
VIILFYRHYKYELDLRLTGGYAVDPQSLEQFEISDERSPSEIAKISNAGYEVVWKDWDRSFSR